MAKVQCTLENASDKINGVAFEPGQKGMVSEDISLDLAEQFAQIPGYEIIDDSELEKPEKAAGKKPAGKKAADDVGADDTSASA